MANLIGEAIDSYLSSQIDVRQKLTGKGLYDNPKLTNTDINLLNNKNAWLKLASSVYMGNPQIQKSAKEAGASSQQIDRLKTLLVNEGTSFSKVRKDVFDGLENCLIYVSSRPPIFTSLEAPKASDKTLNRFSLAENTSFPILFNKPLLNL